ncbi:MAG: hypothetical protein M3P33_00935 [bacterium]|nr:hypothetical protein [bacterium]
MDQDLLNYVGQALIRDTPVHELRAELISVGWDPVMVDEAIEKLTPSGLQQFSKLKIYGANENPDAQPLIVKKHYNITPVLTKIVVGVMIFFVFGTGILFIKDKFFNEPLAISPPDIDQTSANATPTQFYYNVEHGFSVNIPPDWSVKEYPKDTYGDEWRIAFGFADDLPTDYFNEGSYIWIKIYPITNSKNYADFTYFASQVGQDKTTKTTLGGNVAFDTGVGVYSERKGFVYELYLSAIKDSGGNNIYTQTSKQAWNSFKFVRKK